MDADADRDAFKRGFIENCKKAGLSLQAMHDLVDFALSGNGAAEKAAFFPTFLGGSGTGALARLAPRLAARLAPYAERMRSVLGPAALATGAGALGATMAGGASNVANAAITQGPNIYMQALPYVVGLGGTAGLVLGSGIGSGMAAMDDDAETPEQIKAKELAQTYKTYADQIQAKKQYQLSRHK